MATMSDDVIRSARKIGERRGVSDFVDRLSPRVQEAIKKDLVWKLRCFVHYASIQKEKEGTTERENANWGAW